MVNKSSSTKIFIGAILIILVVVLIAGNQTTEEQQTYRLKAVDKPYEAGMEGEWSSMNTNRVAPELLEPGTFTGKKPNALRTFFTNLLAGNLFSFTTVEVDDLPSSCGTAKSISDSYVLDYGTESTAYQCDAGDYVMWMFGDDNVPSGFSAGQKMFDHAWEKIWGSRMQFNNYWVIQDGLHPTTYKYACYDCSALAPEEYTCEDFDGGLDEHVASNVHVYVTSNPAIDTWYEDFCATTGTSVVEAYCNGDDYDYQYIYCDGYGCDDGACLGSTGTPPAPSHTCYESDGGENYDMFATTTVKLGTSVVDQESDECIDSTTLREYYCSANEEDILVNDNVCSSGDECVDGECVSSGTGTEPTGPTYNDCETFVCGGYLDQNVWCQDSNGDLTGENQNCLGTEECINGVCVLLPPPPPPTYVSCVSTMCVGPDVYCIDSLGDQILEISCGANSYCDPSTTTCESVDCTNDNDCPLGVCMFDHTCGCTTNAECGTSAMCQAQECVAVECTIDSQCPGETCLSNNQCGCDTINDCDGTSICTNSACIAVDCINTNDCDPLEQCTSNVCQPVNCMQDNDCALGICLSNECGCTTNSQCGDQALCDAGICSPVECTLNTQCEEGYLCETNACVLLTQATTTPSETTPPSEEEPTEEVTLTEIASVEDATEALKQGDVLTWAVALAGLAVIFYFVFRKKKPTKSYTIIKHKKSKKRR